MLFKSDWPTIDEILTKLSQTLETVTAQGYEVGSNVQFWIFDFKQASLTLCLISGGNKGSKLI